jgi:pilus assembly protein Flp/PilA
MLSLPNEEGQGLVEYAMILVSIAIVVLVLLSLLGDQVLAFFSTITSEVAAVVS